jgi:hypothetical protein
MKACASIVALLCFGSAIVACEDTSSGGSGIDAGNPEGGFGSDGGTSDPDSGADSGPSCPAPKGPGTEHQGNTITSNETWTAAASPHVIVDSIAISATLTIEPCAEVVLGSIKSLAVNPTGKLVAEGRAGQPIKFRASDPTKPFAQLYASGGGTLRLAYVDIENGGAPQNAPLEGTGTIYAQGSDQTAPTQEIVSVDHVTVKGSQSNGIFLDDGAGFAANSKDLTITGAKAFPMSLSSRALSTVPSGTYTGNKTDEILLPGGGGADAVQEDSTMHERGVPYRIGNDASSGYLVVEKQTPGGFATLTIEPGVTLRFKKGGELIVETFAAQSASAGALVAVGTSAKPIVFTSASATPAAGDWIGISFNSVINAPDKINYARVEFAGGLTGSGSETCNTDPTIPDAAIRVRGFTSNAFITNTTIVNSAAHGIDRGWSNDIKTDFLPTNTFLNVAACKITYPRNTDSSCPAIPPCPR